MAGKLYLKIPTQLWHHCHRIPICPENWVTINYLGVFPLSSGVVFRWWPTNGQNCCCTAVLLYCWTAVLLCYLHCCIVSQVAWPYHMTLLCSPMSRPHLLVVFHHPMSRSCVKFCDMILWHGPMAACLSQIIPVFQRFHATEAMRNCVVLYISANSICESHDATKTHYFRVRKRQL